MSVRPTHFLALPLCTHQNLRTRVAAFQNDLLAANPPIAGLDRSIVIDPRRLHITLGVMTLYPDGPHSVESALSLLQSLQPSIAVLLQGKNAVKVRLDSLDILKPDRDRSNAHVLFLGPSTLDDDGARLQAVCNLVNKAFADAGFITETRPLKLHCTILNTTYRRPRSRMPFSYADILASTAYNTVHTAGFGTYDIRRIELLRMGSYGPNNEYVSCGGTELLT
ncbi:hypothetical protein AX14_010157 [Amanita brunnescens Koide BX004]|nr:hypothetical protein AX14_010157 [Amanita brunnescens Koide BX004]